MDPGWYPAAGWDGTTARNHQAVAINTMAMAMARMTQAVSDGQRRAGPK
jgi:hypothetical protein